MTEVYAQALTNLSTQFLFVKLMENMLKLNLK